MDYSGKRIGNRRSRAREKSARRRYSLAYSAPSNLIYADATWTQQLPDWTGAHVRMFRFFGGVAETAGSRQPEERRQQGLVLRFPKSTEPMARWPTHYSVGILPARPGKPRDKAKVEAGVRFAQTYILGRLRAQTFFSLAECNQAIASCHAAHERASDAQTGVKPARAVREDRTRRPQRTCLPRIGSSRSGDELGSTSIITSRSMTFCTRFRTRSFAGRSRCARHRAHRSRSFHRGQRVARPRPPP